MFENADNIKIVAYLLSVGGIMLGTILGLIVYIFKEHVKDNHLCFSRNDHEHERIFDKIDCKADKKG